MTEKAYRRLRKHIRLHTPEPDANCRVARRPNLLTNEEKVSL